MTGRDVGIGVDESTYRRIIIPALQVIEARFIVVVVAAITNEVGLFYILARRALVVKQKAGLQLHASLFLCD